jgi:diguanylate cyclase (GGDEF)-like protein/PAS domain S-box-containing protein
METAGARRWFLSAVSPMTERQVVWVARDITARREMEAALRASEERYRLFFEASPRPMWVYDAESLAFLAVNDAATREYGWSREEFLAMTLRDIRPPEDIPALDEDVVRADDGHGATRTWRHITRSGRLVMVEISSHPIVFAGRPARLVLVNDVTTQLAAAEAVRASEARFRAIFDHAALGIILMDLDGTVRATNPAFQRLLGLSAAELRRASRAELAQLAESESTRGVVRDIVDQVRESATLEKRYVRVDGEVVWVSLTVSRADADGRGRLIGMVQDITDRKALEAQLLHQAFHDPLTGLANRALFRDRVEHALARAERERNRVAVLFLDLDDFKAVNDTRGHAEGDRLLADIAQRLLNATRGCDTVARLGGDEFAVLLENVREDGDAVVVAERVHASLLPPSDLAGSPVAVSASIGIARAGDGDGAEELLRNADVAMYMAKNAGKGRHVLYAPAMHTALVDRLVLAADLRHAVERAELRLHYQPIVALATGRIVGLEALVRWQHPLRGLLLPGAFISEAEESGYIESLGRWVLREACRQAVALERERARSGVLAHGPALTMAVNLSARQLASETLVADITEALATSGLHPASLVLEITESTIVDQSSAALETLRAIKTLGVKLAIDDFGTGYSSLSYLQRFPLDTIKIDKAFVDGMARGGNHVALTRTIIALGDMLSLRTVAEGVETEQQRTMLLELGCECAQGHLFAEALAADELTRRLTADYADELTDSAAATAEH